MRRPALSRPHRWISVPFRPGRRNRMNRRLQGNARGLMSLDDRIRAAEVDEEGLEELSTSHRLAGEEKTVSRVGLRVGHSRRQERVTTAGNHHIVREHVEGVQRRHHLAGRENSGFGIRAGIVGHDLPEVEVRSRAPALRPEVSHRHLSVDEICDRNVGGGG
ncbi:uncharacterized protein LY79DRAFT_568913 [Colletotrichum navitas]|uniref:Uncharacterized protein n=1 Tax=Colletotrichum navitas TaxID=681940 RepID=A0AAD8UZ54_9PEZI|nr:uncharacterized protein LY79DRAFT_568913 [Colletotrichum navitas]KAK1573282.1 hypothetical protein LY79DRAFT_568913 [Colletotrichum navitas]